LEVELQLGGGRVVSLHLQELVSGLLLVLGGGILEVVQRLLVGLVDLLAEV
jgi:hypothetical protein